MAVAPGASAPTADARNAATAKSPANGRAPQFLEPQNEPPEHSTSESVRDISLQLSNKDQGRVQVRLSERAGELHVSVRTPDAGLTRGLRDGLSDLVGRLEHNGYRAETWQPAGRSGTGAQDQNHDSPSQNQSSGQQNAGDSGSGGGRQQNARDQQHPDAQPPKWVSELESSLQRSNSPWLPSAVR
jgi:hypothetical protein